MLAEAYLKRGSYPPGTLKRFCLTHGIRKADLVLALDRQRALTRENLRLSEGRR